MNDWKLLLRTGFGNVFPLGRWTIASTVLIARGYNTGDWSDAVDYAYDTPWDPQHAN